MKTRFLLSDSSGLEIKKDLIKYFQMCFEKYESIFSEEHKVNTKLLATEVLNCIENDFIFVSEDKKYISHGKAVLNIILGWCLAIIKRDDFPDLIMSTSYNKKIKEVPPLDFTAYVKTAKKFKTSVVHQKEFINVDLYKHLVSSKSTIEERYEFTQQLFIYRTRLAEAEKAFFRLPNEFISLEQTSKLGNQLVNHLISKNFRLNVGDYRKSFDRFRHKNSPKTDENKTELRKKTTLDISYQDRKSNKRGAKNLKPKIKKEK